MSYAGDPALVLCDVSTVHGNYSDDVQCLVAYEQHATSTALSGYFQLTLEDSVTGLIPFNADADIVQNAIESVISRDVKVTRNPLELDGSFEWLVTFLNNRGDEPAMVVNAAGIFGTYASFEVEETQRGSFLDGSFSLSFMGAISSPIVYNVLPDDLSAVITAMGAGSLISINVSKIPISNGWRYYVLFVGGYSDFDRIEILNYSLLGSAASVRSYEVQKGAGTIDGTFSLSFENETTDMLTFQSTASDVESALSQLNTVGDIRVSLDAATENKNVIVWYVTFTSFGNPINVGDLPMIQYSTMFPNIKNVNMSVTEIQPGCCNVALTYNANHEKSTVLLPLAVDNTPTITTISPFSGPLSGGVNVSI